MPYIVDEEGNEVFVPEEQPVPVVEQSKIEVNGGDDMSDLFKAPDPDTDEDMQTDDLTSVDDEDVMGEGDPDMSDLLDVPQETVMGERPRKPKFQRTVKRYEPYQPPAMGETRF